MDLILWRHAEAHPGSPDPARRLTGKGKRQAARMARWLKNRLPRDATILVSPTQRTRQTADALGMRYRICDDLAQGKTAKQVLAACGWPDAGQTVVLVGHQPALGQAASMIMTGSGADWAIKKGGAWWFSGVPGNDQAPVVLEAAMSPGLLRKK